MEPLKTFISDLCVGDGAHKISINIIFISFAALKDYFAQKKIILDSV